MSSQSARQIFHESMRARPALCLCWSLFFAAQAVMSAFNLVDSPRWAAHPWQGWLMGAIALVPALYFSFTAASGIRQRLQARRQIKIKSQQDSR